MTLLELVSRVVRELGVSSPPNTVTGSAAQDIIQIYALANSVGRKLARAHPWQALVKEHRFSPVTVDATGTVAAGSAVLSVPDTAGLSTNFGVQGFGIPWDTYVKSVDNATQVTLSQAATETGSGDVSFGQMKFAMPSDFYRLMDRTQWDRTNHWELLGPTTPPQWQWLKSGFIATGPRIRWRILGDRFQIWPQQAKSNQLGFEYLSSHWVTSSTGTSKGEYSADTDAAMFDPELMTVGTKLEYFAIKGFDTTRLQVEFDAMLNDLKAAEGGSPTLNMAPKVADVLLGWNNIPDSGYGT